MERLEIAGLLLGAVLVLVTVGLVFWQAVPGVAGVLIIAASVPRGDRS